uniref:Pre-mRNA-processing factor 39 n=1 Tax=Glossina pallidipes TaxID=7398 RepID=A0A1A9ZJI0_GLOPL
MASTNEEEIVSQELQGRRTRSGRKLTSSQISPVTPSRSSRRNARKQAQEQLIEHAVEETNSIHTIQEEQQQEENSAIIQEMLAEAAQGVLMDPENQCHVAEILEEEVVEEIVTTVEGEECIIYEDPEQIPREEMDMYEVVQEENPVVSSETAIDEKSSSFPFGTVCAQSETSEDAGDHHANLDNNGGVENSLLASLAGDNANSLPSVGGGESETDGSKREEFEQSKVIENCEKMESDDSLSEPAIAEELNAGMDGSDATIVNTEMVSEDELPLPTKPEINDAEEVSDEELPAPQRAELPADAEVISEDELPASTNMGDKHSPSPSQSDESGITRKKRKADVVNEATSIKIEKDETTKKKDEQYNPMSPTSESNDSPPVEKKAKFEENIDNKDKDKRKDKEKERDKEKDAVKEKDKERDKDKEKERKKLPDLDKYWRAVKDDPADFTGWTYLLQYVDNESDAEAAREAYDAFLAHYPYCYGYWRKYADYEKRKGIKVNCNAVFERGLEAIPLSVDLWIHYLTHVKSNHADQEDYIRSQFERAVEACGLEFRSDKLWDAYLKWENENKCYQRMVKIYDRLLAIPTQGYSGHFDNFQDLINQHSIINIISSEEIKRIRQELRDGKLPTSNRLKSRRGSSKEKESEHREKEKLKDEEVGDNKEKDKDCKSIREAGLIDVDEKLQRPGDDLTDLSTLSEDEVSSIKDKVISIRRKLHKSTVAAVTARWSYEEGIKRPYFHVKPLERCQLKNWKDYLDFEIEKGDRKRVLVLFERCLIACALYDEFWLKMIRYLETQHDQTDNAAITRDVYRRACEIHHPDKPSLHLMWAAFEECQNNFDKAAEILINLEKRVPNLLQVAYRRINVERRRGDHDKCKELYEHYINVAKNKNIAGSLAIKYARFLNKICNDLEGGLRVLRQALEKDSANTRVALQMIDLALQRQQVDEDEVVLIMDKFMARENIDPEQKVLFAQRKVEFLEDFGSTAKGLQDAQRSLQLALTKANEAKKKRDSSPSRKPAKDVSSISTSNPVNYNNGSVQNTANYNYNSGNSTAYYGQQNNSGSYPPPQSYDNYYNHWQYGSGYSGYGQWSGYGNYY